LHFASFPRPCADRPHGDACPPLTAQRRTIGNSTIIRKPEILLARREQYSVSTIYGTARADAALWCTGVCWMRTCLISLITLLAIAAAPAAAARQSMQERGAAELAKELKGLIPGTPEKCVSLSSVDGSHIIDGTAIVYRGLGGKTYVNRTLNPELLREDGIPVQFVYGSQLCRLDQVRLLDRFSRIPRGTVGLDSFVPYTKPAKAR
jgi:hypothetical protein